VCEAAAFDALPVEAIKAALLSQVDFLRDLPRHAAEAGVQQEVIDRACDGCAILAEVGGTLGN
ncbi:MAG TPA: hypothetical protein HPP80_06085, partial [Rhodospirillaceae bacterium]|nr:hypothetical protein [Rhodospirillaceae bacterium]